MHLKRYLFKKKICYSFQLPFCRADVSFAGVQAGLSLSTFSSVSCW